MKKSILIVALFSMLNAESQVINQPNDNQPRCFPQDDGTVLCIPSKNDIKKANKKREAKTIIWKKVKKSKK